MPQPTVDVRGILAGVFAVAGLSTFGSGLAYGYHLSRTSPAQPMPATGQIVQKGRVKPHYYVTHSQNALEENLFVVGVAFVFAGGALNRRKSAEPDRDDPA